MMALSALCVTWKERAPDTAVIEMGLEDKMERTRRDFWICFLLWASWHLPRFCKWQLEHLLCSPTPCVQPQLCRTHSFFAKCFQFEDISVFYFKEKKKKGKITENILNKNSLQKLARVTKAVLFWLLWICYTRRHCKNSGWAPLYPTSDYCRHKCHGHIKPRVVPRLSTLRIRDVNVGVVVVLLLTRAISKSSQRVFCSVSQNSKSSTAFSLNSPDVTQYTSPGSGGTAVLLYLPLSSNHWAAFQVKIKPSLCC